MAVTGDRSTPTMGQAGKSYSYPVAASTTLYKGIMVCLNASGYAVAGAAATGQSTALLSLEHIDNSAGSNGTLSINCSEAVAYLKKHGTITIANIDQVCYYYDNETVTMSSSGSSKAGVVVQVDSNGVWVKLASPAVGV